MTLLNAFNLPEDSITADTYETAFQHLNSSYHHIVLGLDIKTCDKQKLLSEVILWDLSGFSHIRSFTHIHLLQGVEGTGLAFIVFTEAITKMPGSPAWSVLFFVMLLCLGISTLFGNIEGVVVPLKDLKILSQKWPQEAVTGILHFGCNFGSI